MPRRITTTLLLTLTALMPLASCSSDLTSETDFQKDATRTIQFAISPYESAAFRSAASEAFSQLSFALFPTNDTIASIEVVQDEADNDFGTISAEIPFGSYELVIVGHNGESAATIASTERVEFPNNRVTDSFCHYQTLSISESTPAVLSIELKRCVAKFEAVATDAIPEWATKMNFVATGGGVALNAKTGLACEVSTQDKTSNIPASFAGKTGKFFSLYSFLPAKDAAMSITLNAIDANGNTRLTHTFTDVPMAVNQITRYTGELFRTSVNANGSITADTEWNAVNEYTF